MCLGSCCVVRANQTGADGRRRAVSSYFFCWRRGSLKSSKSSPYRLFSRLLLNSLIMSERKSRRTSISSALGAELFSRVATTLSITGEKQANKSTNGITTSSVTAGSRWSRSGSRRLTGVLDLDGGVGILVRLVDDLRAHLLRQDLVQREESAGRDGSRAQVQTHKITRSLQEDAAVTS